MPAGVEGVGTRDRAVVAQDREAGHAVPPRLRALGQHPTAVVRERDEAVGAGPPGTVTGRGEHRPARPAGVGGPRREPRDAAVLVDVGRVQHRSGSVDDAVGGRDEDPVVAGGVDEDRAASAFGSLLLAGPRALDRGDAVALRHPGQRELARPSTLEVVRPVAVVQPAHDRVVRRDPEAEVVQEALPDDGPARVDPLELGADLGGRDPEGAAAHAHPLPEGEVAEPERGAVRPVEAVVAAEELAAGSRGRTRSGVERRWPARRPGRPAVPQSRRRGAAGAPYDVAEDARRGVTSTPVSRAAAAERRPREVVMTARTPRIGRWLSVRRPSSRRGRCP